MARREYTSEQKTRRAIYYKAWSEKNKDKLTAEAASKMYRYAVKVCPERMAA